MTIEEIIRKKSEKWKCKVFLHKGYPIITIKESGKFRQIEEHRHVIEINIGRRLLKKEIVHHKNEIKHDNRLENLQIMTKEEHTKFHKKGKKSTEQTVLKLKEAWAKSIQRGIKCRHYSIDNSVDEIIRTLKQDGLTFDEIAKLLLISKSHTLNFFHKRIKRIQK